MAAAPASKGGAGRARGGRAERRGPSCGSGATLAACYRTAAERGSATRGGLVGSLALGGVVARCSAAVSLDPGVPALVDGGG
jgi:hypothetical protein